MSDRLATSLAQPAVASDRLLIGGEVAALLRVSPRTLECWRRNGNGPQWIRSGRRALYPESGIRAYLADPARRSA